MGIVISDNDNDRTVGTVYPTYTRIALIVHGNPDGSEKGPGNVGSPDPVEPHLVLRVPAEAHTRLRL